MPIEAKDAFEVIGLDPSKFEDVDAFKEAIEQKWLPKDSAHNDKEVAGKIIGKFNRVLRTKFGKVGTELGVDIDDTADPIDIFEKQLAPAIVEKAKEVGSWKEKAEKAVGDDVVKEYTAKIKGLEKERETFASQAKEWQSKYEGLDTEVKQGKRKSVVDNEWNAALGAIQFHQGVDDLKRKGFVASVKEKYKIDLDDEFKPKMLDANGNPVKHPKKAGELLSLKEAVEMEAKALKLVAENPHANKPVAPQRQAPRTVLFGQQQHAGGEGGPKPRPIAPRMM
jgi:hypothetical protein